MCIKWNNVISGCFTVANGTRQGGVLSPYLFSRYIRGMLHNIASSRTGCYIGNLPLNVLAYADDIVCYPIMAWTSVSHRQYVCMWP